MKGVLSEILIYSRRKTKTNTAVEIIKKIDGYLAKGEEVLIVLILSLMIVLSFGQVILRNVFHQGIFWADIFLRQMVLWVGFLGASLAARDGRHISIDFLPHYLSPFWRAVSKVIVQAIAGVASGFLAWAAWKFVRFEKEAGTVLFLDYPVWLFQTVLPFSFGVIAIRFVLQAIQGGSEIKR